jgi:signal transduction histidine kinase
LSNVVRHAAATQVRVLVRTQDGTFTIMVVDNGVGVDDAQPRGGLVNMRRRALAHGGSFEIQPTQPTGTTIVWTAPV